MGMSNFKTAQMPMFTAKSIIGIVSGKLLRKPLLYPTELRGQRGPLKVELGYVISPILIENHDLSSNFTTSIGENSGRVSPT